MNSVEKRNSIQEIFSESSSQVATKKYSGRFSMGCDVINDKQMEFTAQTEYFMDWTREISWPTLHPTLGTEFAIPEVSGAFYCD